MIYSHFLFISRLQFTFFYNLQYPDFQGAGVSSALIAVMSLKLELSRAEKHVNNFMTDTKLSRQVKSFKYFLSGGHFRN